MLTRTSIQQHLPFSFFVFSAKNYESRMAAREFVSICQLFSPVEIKQLAGLVEPHSVVRRLLLSLEEIPMVEARS